MRIDLSVLWPDVVVDAVRRLVIDNTPAVGLLGPILVKEGHGRLRRTRRGSVVRNDLDGPVDPIEEGLI